MSITYRSGSNLKARALQMVNAVRVAAGLAPLNELRKGYRNQAHNCPIANSLSELGPGVKVGTYTIEGVPTDKVWRISGLMGKKIVEHNGTAKLENPSEFAEFVRAFDNGSIPELDANRYY